MDKQSRAARKKHHVIYKTTCKVTGRYYVGMHSTDNLADGYIGSGKRLWQSIKKHGAEQHHCEILEHLPSREALRLRESELVNKELLEDSKCMNIALGGEGGWEHQNSNSEVQRRKCIRGNIKQAELRLTNPAWVNKVSLAVSTGLLNCWASGARKPIEGFNLAFLGRKHSAKSKDKIGQANSAMIGAKNSQFGTKWMKLNNQVVKVKSDQIDEHLAKGYVFGR